MTGIARTWAQGQMAAAQGWPWMAAQGEVLRGKPALGCQDGEMAPFNTAYS